MALGCQALDLLDNVTEWLLGVSECAATQWLVVINDALPRMPLLNEALGLFPSLLFGNSFLALAKAELWASKAHSLAARIALRMHGAPVEMKQRAVESFESFVRKVILRCFAGVQLARNEGNRAVSALRDGLGLPTRESAS